MRTLIGHWGDLAGIRCLLARNAHRVTRDPQQWHALRNSRVEISLFLHFGVVAHGDFLGYEATHGGIIVVDVWLEELGEHVGFLVWSLFGLGDGRAFLAVLVVSVVLFALFLEQAAFFGVHGFGEVIDHGAERGVQRDLVERGEDEEEDHKDEWADRSDALASADGKEADKADFGQIEANKELLKSTGVDTALGLKGDVS